jgi:hypothetical protein
MKGYPKNLNTKEDYEYVRQHFPADQWKPDYQKLLDSEKDWFFDSVLDDAESGIEDATHKVMTSESEGENGEKITTYAQYVLKINPTCKLLRLGFTEAEVQEALSSGGDS